MKIKFLLSMPLLSIIFSFGLFAQEVPLVYDKENTGADFPKPAMPSVNQLPTIPNLPDPFEWADARGRIENKSDWEYRRNEIGAQLQNYEIGERPGRPDSITASFSWTDSILTVNVIVSGKTLKLTSKVLLPAGTGPFPAVIGMNSPSGSIPANIFTDRKIARITYNHNQVTTYGTPKGTDPFYQLYPYLNSANTGQYSAWSWGVSRLIDGLELVQDTLPIDLKHLAVTGCSYAGKMAIFCGAFDERIALTIGVESGGGGYTTWRVSETLGGVETLEATDYNWFSDAMKSFAGKVTKLPEDHHELMAMVAPRALLVTGNPDYVWLADESGYVGSKAAKEVWTALGVPDRFGFSIVAGHAHCTLPASQVPQISAFVDKFLLGKDTVTTSVATTPYNSNLAPWITWATPVLGNGSSSISWASLKYPVDRQTNLDTNITFSWKGVTGASKYYIQVSLDLKFATTDYNDSTTSDTVKTFSGLSLGKIYYWHVKVEGAPGVNLWSNTYSFRVITPIPLKVQLVSAAPTFTTRVDRFTFKWNKVDYVDQYHIQISTDQSFATIYKEATITDSTSTMLGFSSGASYYWRVQGVNISGAGPWSDIGNFVAVLTDVKEQKTVPLEYSLSQNFPNPFNPATSIKFALPQTALTKIVIYDLLGREVKILLNKEMAAGYYEVNFNAANLETGVYFYRIQSGNFDRTKKMILMK